MPELPVLVDLVLVGLLVATIVYAAMLNRRLAGLRQDKAGLEELARGFAEATRQAFDGIAELKAAAERSGRELKEAADKASALRDEFLFLVERGETAADRLEAATTARGGRGAGTPPVAIRPVPAASAPVPAAPTPAPAPANDRGALHRKLAALR